MDLSSNSECFGCGRAGHWIKHCPNAGGSRGRGRGRGRGKGTIYYLGHTQHRTFITIIWVTYYSFTALDVCHSLVLRPICNPNLQLQHSRWNILISGGNTWGSCSHKLKPCGLYLCILICVSLQSSSVIGVETKDTWPGTVTKLRMVCIVATFFSISIIVN